MSQLTPRRLLLAIGFMCVAAVQTYAQGVHTTDLLSNGSSCLHVIRSIQIYGVNNSFDVGGTHLAAHHGPFGSYAVPGAEMGDLEFLQISRHQVDDPACGPKFSITIRNNSCRDVCNFHVTVVATLGRIFPGSPHATVCVDKIVAGSAAEVCVQLPVEALAMGNRSGNVIGFQRLVVAIDAFDELAETNEANNLKAFACGEIPLVAAAVVEEATTTEVSQSTTVQTDESVSAAPLPANTNPPATSQPVSVQPNADDGDAAGNDSLRSAIRMLDTPQEQTSTAVTTQ